jgi:chitin disaccharide deacetylase
MKYLVVNADDFGASAGVNRGIVEAHRHGIVTSTSLMVGQPHSEQAARLARECPALSVGLHAVVDGDGRQLGSDADDAGAARVALEGQLERFTGLLGCKPTHLDSHHHVHMRPTVLPHFREFAERCGVPLRDCSGVRYCDRFYGQWAGATHPEHVSTTALTRILTTGVGEGITELGCHPGYTDSTLRSSYAIERELELQTLCDGLVRRFLDTCGILLIDFRQAARMVAAPA